MGNGTENKFNINFNLFFLFSFVRTTTRGRAECIEAMVARGHQSWRNLFRIITPRLAHFKKQFFMHESSVF